MEGSEHHKEPESITFVKQNPCLASFPPFFLMLIQLLSPQPLGKTPITPSCPQSIPTRDRKDAFISGSTIQQAGQGAGRAGRRLAASPHCSVTLGSHSAGSPPLFLLCHLTHGLFPCPPSKPLQTLMSGAIATWTCRAEHLCFHRNLCIQGWRDGTAQPAGLCLSPKPSPVLRAAHPEILSPSPRVSAHIAPRQSTG